MKEVKPYEHSRTSYSILEKKALIVGGNLKCLLWHIWRYEHHAPLMNISDAKNYEASTRTVRAQAEATKIWVQSFDITGSEKHCMYGEPFAEVYEGAMSAHECFCWDIFCCQCLPASFKADNAYEMQSTSRLREWGDATADPDILLKRVE